MKSQKYFQLYGNCFRKVWGRLTRGMPGQVEGTNTIFFIDKADVPVALWKVIIYGLIIVNYRPNKVDPYLK